VVPRGASGRICSAPKTYPRGFREDGVKPGTTGAQNADLHEARKRILLLEQENEVLRLAWPHAPRHSFS
jgi:hypothetical protein